MSYQVRLRSAASKQLDGLPRRDYDAVARAISGLEQEPRPKKVKKLAESGLWRIRVGSLRIVYSIDDKALLVILVRIAKRVESTYKNL